MAAEPTPAPLASEPAPAATASLAPLPLAAVDAAPAPALALATLDGAPFDLAGAGGVTAVHFFAAWCEPCRTELPALARFAARMPAVRVMLVDVADPPARLRRLLDTFPERARLAALPILLDPARAAARAWGVSVLPATFVVAQGHIRLAREGEVAWDDPANDHRLEALMPQAAAAGPASTREQNNGRP